MSSSAVRGVEKGQEPEASSEPSSAGGLEILLHALNQPLTGLQCSIEVALARPRGNEEYVQRMRESLELTERMRILVGAIRELVNDDENQDTPPEAVEIQTMVRDLLEELAPVAEMKGVHVRLDCVEFSPVVMRTGRQAMTRATFRLIESALGLADGGSVLLVSVGRERDASRLGVGWSGIEMPGSSRPELGLLIARASWERIGARWKRERTGNLETVSIHIPVSSAVHPF